MAFKYSPDKMRQGALSRDFIAPSVLRLNAGDIAPRPKNAIQFTDLKIKSTSLKNTVL